MNQKLLNFSPKCIRGGGGAEARATTSAARARKHFVITSFPPFGVRARGPLSHSQPCGAGECNRSDKSHLRDA